MFCLLVLKESMGVNRVSHTGNSRVSFSLKQLGKGHKMEDFESQTSELSFGIPCASKVNDVREIQENEVCTICVWTWYAILIQFSNLGVRVLMGLWSCIFFFFFVSGTFAFPLRAIDIFSIKRQAVHLGPQSTEYGFRGLGFRFSLAVYWLCDRGQVTHPFSASVKW